MRAHHEDTLHANIRVRHRAGAHIGCNAWVLELWTSRTQNCTGLQSPKRDAACAEHKITFFRVLISFRKLLTSLLFVTTSGLRNLIASGTFLLSSSKYSYLSTSPNSPAGEKKGVRETKDTRGNRRLVGIYCWWCVCGGGGVGGRSRLTLRGSRVTSKVLDKCQAVGKQVIRGEPLLELFLDRLDHPREFAIFLLTGGASGPAAQRFGCHPDKEHTSCCFSRRRPKTLRRSSSRWKPGITAPDSQL